MNEIKLERISKAKALLQLQNATTENLWDHLLKLQVDLYFDQEIYLLSDQIWWQNSQNILEIGCGNGEYLSRLATTFSDKNYTGFDITISNGQLNNKHISFLKGDAELFNEQLASQFDAVIFRLTLQHLKNPELALEHAFHYLKPGGHVLIIDSCDSSKKNSHPIPSLEEGMKILNLRNQQKGEGNRFITLQVLRDLSDEKSALAKLFTLLFTSLTNKGENNLGSGRILFNAKRDRTLYFNQGLFFLEIVRRKCELPIDLSRAYDELQVYIENDQSWFIPGFHQLVLKRK
jgi:SAM-dependent methyltransferase